MRILTLLVLIVLHPDLQAQKDSIHLDEVIITATKTQRSLASLPMPVTVVKSKEIAMTGTSRLQDILAEQNVLTIVPQINGFGKTWWYKIFQIPGLSFVRPQKSCIMPKDVLVINLMLPEN